MAGCSGVSSNDYTASKFRKKKLMNFHLNLIIIIVFLLERILVIILKDIKEIIPLGSQICRILLTLFHMLHKSTAT